ncbi:MAG: phytoene desaturase family protein [Acidimicrobiales bacterium]
MIVVGAGLAGLSAVCHLSRSGHSVVVLEAGERPGGRANIVGSHGYQLDNGPTVLTMIDLIAETIAATGSVLEDVLDLVAVEPGYVAHFADGSRFDGDGSISVFADELLMREEILRVSDQRNADAYGRFRRALQAMYEAEFPTFIDANLGSVSDLVGRWRSLIELVRLGGFRRLDAYVRRYFTDDRLIRLFSFQALYAGLSPIEALGIYSVIAYMDAVAGVYFPKGGIAALPLAMARAAEKAGVEFRYGSMVTEYAARKHASRIDGVVLSDGEVLDADVVISTVELPEIDNALKQTHDRGMARLQTLEYSPSAYLMLLGVRDDATPQPPHHSIYFGHLWAEPFEDLLRNGRLMRDPSILVSSPTATDPSLAPEGGRVLYVLEPVPNLTAGIDWHTESSPTRARLLGKLEEVGLLSPTATIEAEDITTPIDWLNRGMPLGTPFSVSHRFFQSGPFRSRNIHPRFGNLIFAGSGTTPGVGVPMVLISGKLAAERVEEMA